MLLMDRNDKNQRDKKQSEGFIDKFHPWHGDWCISPWMLCKHVAVVKEERKRKRWIKERERGEKRERDRKRERKNERKRGKGRENGRDGLKERGREESKRERKIEIKRGRERQKEEKREEKRSPEVVPVSSQLKGCQSWFDIHPAVLVWLRRCPEARGHCPALAHMCG